MGQPLAEYTVRDYSAVDKQVDQIAERERVFTNKIKIGNYRQLTILGVGGMLAFGLFLIMAATAYRIAFPPDTEVIETTKVVEKTVTPKITIETPAGSVVTENQPGPPNVKLTPAGGVSIVSGQEGDSVDEEMDERLKGSDVNNAASDPYITLSWDNFNDLDLVVDEPGGNRIFFRNPQRKLDVDANRNGTKAIRRPVENISWPGNQAARGKYKVSVIFYRRDNREPVEGETRFSVRIFNAGTKDIITGVFANNTALRTFKQIAEFEVGTKPENKLGSQ